ncbi:hypothetical protein RFM99_15775 [Mesorhizobium sp. VK4C]|uniref:hypothetical protein n=1 Tax=Mesorhizobium captivum TaxID=3072319 RepID=UPI002A24B061|nr:hypothetical protein [Mesorhizobium sp. VK4C]MDX8499878.1 hypothetical protein [Mesorhizobium sp. VK4C]
MKNATTILIAATLLSSHDAFAWKVLGQGNLSCGSWVKSAGPERYIYETWLLGFISGTQYGSKTYSFNVDVDAIDVYMTNYCTAHPLENIVQGAKNLAADLVERSTP